MRLDHLLSKELLFVETLLMSSECGDWSVCSRVEHQSSGAVPAVLVSTASALWGGCVENGGVGVVLRVVRCWVSEGSAVRLVSWLWPCHDCHGVIVCGGVVVGLVF